MIALGSEVKDKYSGYKGIAVARTEFINGCVQYHVVAKVTKEHPQPEEIDIDEESLEVIKKNTARATNGRATGGAYTRPKKMRGY